MANGIESFVTGGGIPNTCRRVHAGSGDRFAIRAEGGANGAKSLPQIGPDALPGFRVPNLSRATSSAIVGRKRAGDQPLAVGCEGDRKDSGSIELRFDRFATGDIPHPQAAPLKLSKPG